MHMQASASGRLATGGVHRDGANLYLHHYNPTQAFSKACYNHLAGYHNTLWLISSEQAMSSSSTEATRRNSRTSSLVSTTTSSTPHDNTQATDKVTSEADPDCGAQVGQRSARFQLWLKPMSQRRVLFGLALKSSGSTLNSSGISSSADNLGAASTAFAELSQHLDLVLQQQEGTKLVKYANTCKR